MLDGMDVMVISYAAPAIAKAWGTSPQTLGGVFSAGLFGMAVGAIFLAPFGDRLGRRTVILWAALVMGLSVGQTSLAQSVEQIVFFRFCSGLGIGAVLASTATLAAEFSPPKNKAFWVSFVMSGYPVGAVLAGLVAAHIIPKYGWQAMFQLAGAASLVAIPLIFIYLSESLDFLLRKQPRNALQKVNSILGKMNKRQLLELPAVEAQNSVKTSVAILLSTNKKTATLNLWLALFMAFATLYFLTAWIPKLASGAGLPLELAIYAGTVFNLGAFAGIVTQGWLSSKFSLQRTIFCFLTATAFLMVIFGFFKSPLLVLVMFGMIGFAIQGGFVGLYAVAAQLYPTEIRSTGVGWAMGAGRIGAIVAPTFGGFLVAEGLSMTSNFLVFAIPTMVAGLAVLKIKL
ncbi:MAG: MFS transporter [Bacteroidota bacterium]